METKAADEAPIGNPALFRYSPDGETLFYPPYIPWRPFIVESEEEQARLSSDWTFMQFLLTVSIAIVAVSYLAFSMGYSIPDITGLALLPIMYGMYLLFFWWRFRSEYSPPRRRAPKLGFLEYNRQTAEKTSISQLKFQVSLSLMAALILAWLRPDDVGDCVLATIFILLFAHRTLLLGLKLGANR